MGVRVPEAHNAPRRFHPTLAGAALAGLAVLAVLLANGRPIPAGDTRPTERVAASLVEELDFDLDEHPGVQAPFARQVGEHRVSIYPVFAAVLAAPVFALARLGLPLDETGCALAGKWAAALLSSLAMVTLFLALGRRHGEHDAFRSVLLLALGTSVWSTSQALWQHPAAVLLLALALLCTVRAEDDDVWAARAGLPLALAVAARHGDVLLAAALAVGLAVRWPRRVPGLLLWALPGVVFVLGYQWFYFGAPWRHGFTGSLGRFSEPWGVGQLGLLVSPAKGLLVFTPLAVVALVGLVRAFREGERWLSATLGLGFLAHWLLMGRWSEWHGGVSYGPRLMTDALPFLFFFLPEGWSVMRRPAIVLAALSVGVQAVGAFAYDMRWERLYQHPPSATGRELWDLRRSPLLLHARERVFKLAMPARVDGRAFVREHLLVLGDTTGSSVRFDSGHLSVGGPDATLSDVHLQRGARVVAGTLRLNGRWDALFLRVQSRVRHLELHVRGRGRGPLYVGESTFWSRSPRWKTYTLSGAFHVRHAYHYPDSGGPDVRITVGKGGGEAQIESVALLPAGSAASPR